MSTDVFGWYQIAAQGGHAGPASTVSYIHQIEAAFALVSKLARPHAWLPEHVEGKSVNGLQDVGFGLLGARRPMPPRTASAPTAQQSSEIGIWTREAVVRRVADGLKLESIASELSITVDLIAKVLDEMAQAMVQMQFVKQDVMLSIHRQCRAVSAHALWARSAKQEKFLCLARHLDEGIKQEKLKAMLLIWQDWCLCRVDEFVALENPRPAARIIELLLRIGVKRQSLAVTGMKGAAPLASQLKKFEIPAGPSCNVRSKRVSHRLVLTANGIDASKASGATISMKGFHWWMLLLGSLLIAKEEI